MIGPVDGPDPSPHAPRLVGADPTGVADKAAAFAQRLADRRGGRILRTFVSREEAWGVVWRADMAPSAGDSGSVFRVWIWMDADGCLQLFMQPLTMFDPAASVTALPED